MILIDPTGDRDCYKARRDPLCEETANRLRQGKERM